VDRTLLLGDNRSFGTGCGLGEPPCPAAGCADSPPLDWGDSRVSSFPGSGLEHPATVLILGGIDDLYLAVSARHIQFPEWAFFYPGDLDDGRRVGIASSFGIAMFVRLKSSLSWTTRLIALVLGIAIQIVCFRISCLPAIPQR
jgi:hypothetical protein